MDEAEIEDVEDLIHYYENNREGLVPYQSQDLELPAPPEGAGIPERGDNGKSCVECDRETDETRAQKLEPAGREPFGEDTGQKMQRKAA